MEVNKEQAEKCRDLGAAALRKEDYILAAKMLKKSLQLYPLPGVEALAAHATSKLAEQNTTRQNGAANNATNGESAYASANGYSSNGSSAATTNGRPTTTQPQERMGEDGRSYTSEQHEIVQKVLRSKQGGRGAHYRVLGIAQGANEAEIKRAYRKLSLKVHPDKNSAPGANDAFKAVSLAYATLSDEQKRTIYDRYGDEDPDENRPGRGGPGGGVHMRHGGQEMTPEDIFNAFFNGHMGGVGGSGMHFYSNGFGPGVQFRAGGPQRRGPGQGQPQQQQPHPNTGFTSLFQLLPVLFFILLSLLSSSGNDGTTNTMPGEGKYFMLTNTPPFTNPVVTKYNQVRDIPYFVTDSFRRSYLNDKYNRKRVEYMVEAAYENFLTNECQKQKNYKQRMVQTAKRTTDPKEQLRQLKLAEDVSLNRCLEKDEFFPPSQQRKQRAPY